MRSQDLAAKAWTGGYFAKSVVPVKDINGITILDNDEHMRPGTTAENLAGLAPAFGVIGEIGGFDAVSLQKYHWVEKINTFTTAATARGSSTALPSCSSVASRPARTWV